MYKFNNRHITRGIQSELPFELQIILWSMIDENIKKGLEMDYLQVFTLKSINIDGMIMQEINHSQEQPEYKNTFAFESDNPISAKIFVIDDLIHSTMLLNYEY